MLFLTTWYTIEMQRLTLLGSLVDHVFEANLKAAVNSWVLNDIRALHPHTKGLVHTSVLSGLSETSLRRPQASVFK